MREWLSARRASLPCRPSRSRSLLIVLAALGVAASPAAAEWTARAEPTGSGTAARCVLDSGPQEMPDGYQQTWVRIVVDDAAVRVVTASELDAGDGDIGLAVDGGDFVPVDEVSGKKTAVFTTRHDTLVEEFKRGLHVKVQLRFWPTWPKTGTHSALFSLIGFTRAHLAGCRAP